jgi:hypothetical protein
LIVVSSLSTVNDITIHWSSTDNSSKKFLLFKANGASVNNRKNGATLNNLMALLASGRDSANNNNTDSTTCVVLEDFEGDVFLWIYLI